MLVYYWKKCNLNSLYPFNTLYSATSESTASLVKILFLIVETVFGLIAKICAIELVEVPSIIWKATSLSRGLNFLSVIVVAVFMNRELEEK